MNKRSGFTLLELIIVVIVIGILASIALPRYIRIAEKGRIAEAKSLLGAIRSAQMRYSAQYGTFAAVVTSLDINMQTPRYFENVAGSDNPGNVAYETTVVAVMTRNSVDNPGLGAYNLNMTQGGVLNYPTTIASMI